MNLTSLSARARGWFSANWRLSINWIRPNRHNCWSWMSKMTIRSKPESVKYLNQFPEFWVARKIWSQKSEKKRRWKCGFYSNLDKDQIGRQDEALDNALFCLLFWFFKFWCWWKPTSMTAFVLVRPVSTHFLERIYWKIKSMKDFLINMEGDLDFFIL